MFVYNIMLLIILLLPISSIIFYLSRNNLRLVILWYFIIIAWACVYKKFVAGDVIPSHDTLWSHYTLYQIINQWIQNRYEIGWDSFSNGGEPLYWYSNYFLRTELFILCFLNKFFELPENQLINLYFCYVIVSFTSFWMMYTIVAVKSMASSIYLFVVLLFSGLTVSTLFQYQISVFYYLPLIMISIDVFLEKRILEFGVISILFLCLSCSYYFPSYTIIIIFLQILSFIVHNFQKILKNGFNITCYNKKLCSLTIAMAIMALVSPIYVYAELSDVVSPTRGNLPLRDMAFGLQKSISLNFNSFKYLVKRPELDGLGSIIDPKNWAQLEFAHSYIYVGILPVILFLSSLSKPNKEKLSYLLMLSILIYISSNSDNNPVWIFITHKIPLFYMRHSYPFALIISVLILLISSFFVKDLNKNSKKLVIVICIVLMPFQINGDAIDSEYNLMRLPISYSYPSERFYFSDNYGPNPFDFEPLIDKRASLSHQSENFIAFRSKDFAKNLNSSGSDMVGPLFQFFPSNDFSLESSESLDLSSELGLPFVKWQKSYAGSGVIGEIPENINIENHGEYLISVRNVIEESVPEAVLGLGIIGSKKNDFFISNSIDLKRQFKSFKISLCFINHSSKPLAIDLSIYSEGIHYEAMNIIDNLNSRQCMNRSIKSEINFGKILLKVKVNTESYGRFTYFSPKIFVQKDNKFIAESIDVKNVHFITKSINPNYVKVEFTAPEDGILLRRENIHKNWNVQLNGNPVAIKNLLGMQSVPVSKGNNVIEYSFISYYHYLMLCYLTSSVMSYLIFIGIVRKYRNELWSK